MRAKFFYYWPISKVKTERPFGWLFFISARGRLGGGFLSAFFNIGVLPSSSIKINPLAFLNQYLAANNAAHARIGIKTQGDPIGSLGNTSGNTRVNNTPNKPHIQKNSHDYYCLPPQSKLGGINWIASLLSLHGPKLAQLRAWGFIDIYVEAIDWLNPYWSHRRCANLKE